MILFCKKNKRKGGNSQLLQLWERGERPLLEGGECVVGEVERVESSHARQSPLHHGADPVARQAQVPQPPEPTKHPHAGVLHAPTHSVVLQLTRREGEKDSQNNV